MWWGPAPQYVRRLEVGAWAAWRGISFLEKAINERLNVPKATVWNFVLSLAGGGGREELREERNIWKASLRFLKRQM
ncbi:hypothetical protein FCM35_KLT11552 [Carex littledalei]|uniref:Uncharacterized protein n=1 Tax=Carex littledalei TaxID=544730 RepID=A0A833QBX7_9POAL|nr:hypothetical protein FCM35_KLT11552 [Carex littledalei]